MFSSDVGDFFGLDVTAKSEESELLESLVKFVESGLLVASVTTLGEFDDGDPKAASKSALIGLISESSSMFLATIVAPPVVGAGEKFAQPSSTFEDADFAGLSKGLSNGVMVEAANGFESQGLPVSIATSLELDPDSITSDPALLSL